jgi:hypothetical protein
VTRRQLITLLGGAAAAWPPMARAQRADRMRLIGFIQVVAENDPEAQARIKAFQQGLAALDWASFTDSPLPVTPLAFKPSSLR